MEIEKSGKKSGFTLVELAIVIVIIGLLVGGVLQGQELINQAKIRRLMADINGYTGSIHTFYSKYNCMPGDCPMAFRVLGSECGTNAPIDEGGCNGNGDRKLSLREGRHLWHQLSMSKILKGSYSADGDEKKEIPQSQFSGQVMAIYSMGDATGGGGCGHTYCGNNSLGGLNDNVFLVGGYNASFFGDGLTNGPLMTPTDAFAFDIKFDDGRYFSGAISSAPSEQRDPVNGGILGLNCGSPTTRAYLTNAGTVNGVPINCPVAFKLGM